MDLERELEQHHRAAFGWALSCSSWDRDLADDVLQTAYLKVLDGRARFEGRSSFRTWLFGVIRRTVAEVRRRRAVGRLVSLEWLDRRTADAEDAAMRLIRSEATQQLMVALKRLPKRQREVLHLVFYQDMSIAEASGVLGISVGTARTHYERGKRRLRQELGGLSEA